MTSRDTRSRRERSTNASVDGCEQGFILVAVLLMVVVILLLMLVTWQVTDFNLGSAKKSDLNIQALGSADAGLSIVSYEIETAKEPTQLPCTVPTLPISPSAQPSGTGASYSASGTVTYFSAYPGTKTNELSCTTVQEGRPVGAASAVVKGMAVAGGTSSSETIEEVLKIADDISGYVVFDASKLTLTSPLTIKPPSGPAPAGSAINVPNLYVSGGLDVPAPGTGAGPGCTTLQAAVVSLEGVTIEEGCHAVVAGGTWIATGSLVLKTATVHGSSTVSDGNITLLTHAQIGGDAAAAGTGSTAGNIHVCGTCTIGGNATASGSVTVTTGGTVKGTKKSGSTAVVPKPTPVPFPTLAAPIASGTTAQQAAVGDWTKAGYTVATPISTCGSGSGGVAAAIAAWAASSSPPPEVIVATCPLTLDATTTAQLKSNLAIFATEGLTVTGTTKQFQAGAASPGASAPQLFLVVPTSSATPRPTCTSGTENLTIGDGAAMTPSLATFFFTPCTFSTPPPANPAPPATAFAGEIVAHEISFGPSVSLSYAGFSAVPDLTLEGIGSPTGSFQITVEQRSVLSGS